MKDTNDEIELFRKEVYGDGGLTVPEWNVLDDYIRWKERKKSTVHDVSEFYKDESDHSDEEAAFTESLRLLRDLADEQNGAPLVRREKQWEATMKEVYDFLNKWEKPEIPNLHRLS